MRYLPGAFVPISILIFLTTFAADPFCRDDLKPKLRELSGFDADAIAKKIDQKKVSLHQIKGQGVFRVFGLPRSQSFMVRKEIRTWYPPDFGISSHGLDLRTQMKRDVAACALDRILGLNLVPETRLSRIAEGEISIQVKVKGEEFPSGHLYQKYVNEKLRSSPEAILRHKTELERMALLDIVSGNTDRNVTNFILNEENNRIWAIDHADSFPVVEKTAGGHWFWLHWSDDLAKPMEPDTRNRILSLDANRIAENLRKMSLLEESALKMMIRRIELLKADLAAHPGSSMRDLGSRVERHIVRFSNEGNAP